MPVEVEVTVDGTPTATSTADADEGQPAGHGFDLVVSLAEGSHDVCVLARNLGAGEDATVGCETVEVDRSPFGILELATADGEATVTGWVIDPDSVDPVEVELLLDGVVAATVTAGREQPDLAVALPQFGSDRGIEATIPYGPGAARLCLRALNVDAGDDALLGCWDL